MDTDTTLTETAQSAIEEYPSTLKTVAITVAATAVTAIGARFLLARHFKKATELVVVETPVDLSDKIPANAA